jgi:hypothetical protein
VTVPHVDEKVGLDHGDCGDHGMDPTYHRMVWRATTLPQPPHSLTRVRVEGLDHYLASRDIRPARKKRSG